MENQIKYTISIAPIIEQFEKVKKEILKLKSEINTIKWKQ
jgi:hypothetical protein